jgi:hypothetical protein
MTRIFFKVTSKLLLTSAALTLSLAATAIASSSLDVEEAQDLLVPSPSPKSYKSKKAPVLNLTIPNQSHTLLDPNTYSSPGQSMSIISLSPQSQKNSKRKSLTKSPKKQSPVTTNSAPVISSINLGALSPLSPHEAIEEKQKALQKKSPAFIDSELFAYILGEKFQQKAQKRRYDFKFPPHQEQKQNLEFLNLAAQQVSPSFKLNLGNKNNISDPIQRFNEEFLRFLEGKGAINKGASLIFPATDFFDLFDESSKQYFQDYQNKPLAYLHLQIGKVLRHLQEDDSEEQIINAERQKNPFARGTNGYEGLILAHYFFDKTLKNLDQKTYIDLTSLEDFAASLLYQQAETHMHLALDSYISSKENAEKAKQLQVISQKAAVYSENLMSFYLAASCIYKPTIYTVSKAIRLLVESTKKINKTIKRDNNHLKEILTRLFHLSFEKDMQNPNFKVILHHEKFDIFALKIIGANEDGSYSSIKKSTPSVLQIELGKAGQYLSPNENEYVDQQVKQEIIILKQEVKEVHNQIFSLDLIKYILEKASSKSALFTYGEELPLDHATIQDLTKIDQHPQYIKELKNKINGVHEKRKNELHQLFDNRLKDESKNLKSMISQNSGNLFDIDNLNIQNSQKKIQGVDALQVFKDIITRLLDSKELNQEIVRLSHLSDVISLLVSQINTEIPSLFLNENHQKKQFENTLQKLEKNSRYIKKAIEEAKKQLMTLLKTPNIQNLGDLKEPFKVLEENIFFSQETQTTLDAISNTINSKSFSQQTLLYLSSLQNYYVSALDKKILAPFLEEEKKKLSDLNALITAQNKLKSLGVISDEIKKRVEDFLGKSDNLSPEGEKARDYLRNSLRFFYNQILLTDFDLSMGNIEWTSEARIIMLAKFYEDARDKKGFFKEEQEKKQKPQQQKKKQ